MHRLQIETASIDALKLQSRNARTHSKWQIRQIADSIQRFGFNNPILTDDNNTVLAGHGRLEAAKLLRMADVPSIRLSHMSESEKRAYIIADNEIAAKAGWDKELLAIELQALIDLGFEVELTGFETAEVDAIILDWQEANAEACAPEDSPIQPVERTTSRDGDLWILGAHRLLCADSRTPDSYDRILESDQAEMVFTDPPYNVPIDGHVSGLGQNKHREFAMASGEMTEAQFQAFLGIIFGAAARVSRDGALHYICIDWRHIYDLIGAGRPIYTKLLNLCIWNKDNGGMGSFYRSKHELVLVFKVGSGAHVNNVQLGRHGRNRTNVWDYAGVNTFRTDRQDELAMHPTVKPVALIADAIKDASRRNDIVLDPFCGSGTTLIACEKTGRRARGLEIDPRYVDVAIRRWQKFSGKKAYPPGS